MRGFLAVVGIFVGVIVVVCGVGWIAEGNNFLLFQYFAPKRAAVERQVFQNTPSFRKGTIVDLQDLQLSYGKADAEHKDAIGSMILQRAADLSEDDLPRDLRSFIHDLKVERGLAR